MRDHRQAPDGADDGVRDLLPALLHGRLAGAERVRVEAHVAACATCATELALLRDVRGAVTAGAPRLDLAAVAAAVRAATVPADRSEPVAPAGTPRAVVPPSVTAPSRWRVGSRFRAVVTTALVAVGAGTVWLARGVPNAVPAAGTAVTAAGRATPVAPTLGTPAAARAAAVPPVPVADRPSAPAVLAAAEPGLGARFDDLSDAELQQVIAAVEGADRALPSAEPDPAAPDVGGGG